MNFDPGPEFAGYVMTAVAVFWVLIIIVHIAFAAGVFADASERRGLQFVAPFVWALATLVGGVFVAGVYWAVHCSTLRPVTPPGASRDEPPARS